MPRWLRITVWSLGGLLFFVVLGVATMVVVGNTAGGRRLLETEMLRRTGSVTADEVAAIAELNARMAAMVDQPSTREWKRLNRELHFRMFRLSGLSHVVAEVSRLWDQTEPYRSVYSSQHDTRARIVAEHDALITALARGATEELIGHMDRHRGASERDVVSVLTR